MKYFALVPPRVLLFAALGAAGALAACGDDAARAPSGAGARGGTAGSGGTAGRAGAAGAASGGTAGMGGAAGSTGGALGGSGGKGGFAGSALGGEGGTSGGECGDPAGDGVIVFEDVVDSTRWTCPVYTLTRPIFVQSGGDERTTLTIDPGVVVRGVRGDLDALKLPGALIVTRTGRLDARGTAENPIVFTSSEPVGERAPGDWGGVVLLGRAPINVPANLEDLGNAEGEMYIEGLPRTERTVYGSAPVALPPGQGGQGGEGGAAGDTSSSAGEGGGEGTGGPDPEWDCGQLEYVRIEFAGFEVAAGSELNGLTMGACGRETTVDRVQVHLGSDDGVEVFGGTVDLRRVVVTGAKDDSLDWDQGWRGRAQFLALQMHDDTLAPPEEKGDNAIEADGWADVESRTGLPSSPRIFNLTLIASPTSHRGMRLREGTQATIRNALILAPTPGATDGLVDLGDALTADFVTSGDLNLENSIFSGGWPLSGQADSSGTLYTEADFFTTGPGSTGNDEVLDATQVLPSAFDEATPGWVPAAGSLAEERAATPSEAPGQSGFFDTGATFRGAFRPGAADWTAGWTAYPRD